MTSSSTCWYFIRSRKASMVSLVCACVSSQLALTWRTMTPRSASHRLYGSPNGISSAEGSDAAESTGCARHPAGSPAGSHVAYKQLRCLLHGNGPAITDALRAASCWLACRLAQHLQTAPLFALRQRPSEGAIPLRQLRDRSLELAHEMMRVTENSLMKCESSPKTRS